MKNISQLREEVDTIDRTLLKLLSKRMKLVQKIAEQKKKSGMPILDKAREAQLKGQWKAKANELGIKSAPRILEEVLDMSKKIQTKVMK